MISFIIPAYNEEELLGYCITSINTELEGKGLLYEIIVVDNNSTDATGELADLYGTDVIDEPIKGVVYARQAGFRHSRGELLAFIDADSQLPEGWLGVMLKVMKPDNVVMCSGPLLFHELGRSKRIMTAMFYSVGAAISRVLPMGQGGNCVIRRKALEAVGGFDTSVEFYGEDTSTAMRLAKVGKVCFVPAMYVYSSSRRMDAEGFMKIGLRYMANFFYMSLTGKVWSKSYRDVRS